MMQYRQKTFYYEDFYLYLTETGRVFDLILVDYHSNISHRNPDPWRGRTSLAGTAHEMHDPEGGRILYFGGG